MEYKTLARLQGSAISGLLEVNSENWRDQVKHNSAMHDRTVTLKDRIQRVQRAMNILKQVNSNWFNPNRLHPLMNKFRLISLPRDETYNAIDPGENVQSALPPS